MKLKWTGLWTGMISISGRSMYIKLKKIVLDPRSIGNHSFVAIKGHGIRQVTSYKYLGVHIVNELDRAKIFLSSLLFSRQTGSLNSEYGLMNSGKRDRVSLYKNNRSELFLSEYQLNLVMG